MKALVIAGTASGVGKTTIAAGVMAALKNRGLRVQPFKVGPDYIDPGYHTLAAGNPSRNLDTWMLPHNAVIELFRRAMQNSDIAVIEGVMGLYDGRSSTNEEGSTAEVAKLLGAPVLLVVDSRKAARSIAAMVLGFQKFDSALSLQGVILNGIGGEGHLRICREAIDHYTGVPVVGYLRRSGEFTLTERHLGLIPTAENSPGKEFFDRLAAQIETSFDIPAMLKMAAQTKVPEVTPGLFPEKPQAPAVRIGVARDKAFSFYYQDSLDLLEGWGAELVPFSPLNDSILPPQISGLYIGGGFPEVYAAELASNADMLAAVRYAAKCGMPVYGECGGLMYLGQNIKDMQGKVFEMSGVLPVSSRIDTPKLSLGYRTVRALADGPLLEKDQETRGHEFHWSILEPGYPPMNAYMIDEHQRREGFQINNVFASYIHLHFGSRPGLAQRFIKICSEYQKADHDR